MVLDSVPPFASVFLLCGPSCRRDSINTPSHLRWRRITIRRELPANHRELSPFVLIIPCSPTAQTTNRVHELSCSSQPRIPGDNPSHKSRRTRLPVARPHPLFPLSAVGARVHAAYSSSCSPPHLHALAERRICRRPPFTLLLHRVRSSNVAAQPWFYSNL